MNASRNCLLKLFVTTLSVQLVASNQIFAQVPRNLDLSSDITKFYVLPQNWSEEESQWFYNVPQGSKLLRYEYFLHLEQPGSEKPFRDAENIRRMGYLARKPDQTGNPDGLPIGFVKDDQHLGITCAACHSTQINHQGRAWLIDGGPALSNAEDLLRGIVDALKATLDNPNKFNRFALSVLKNGATTGAIATLKQELQNTVLLRQGYNNRNLPTAGSPAFGPGRIDAFGAIMNEIAATHAQVLGNHALADAPVSYPFLWDTPQHDFVQWNGAAENNKNFLGKKLVGTEHIGALGRNVGEVLGVFGTLDASQEGSILELKGYPSSINRENLIAIEKSLNNLWSPEWPAELGMIDPTLKAKGQVLYEANCVKCHEPIQRKDPNRKIEAKLLNVGTDPKMAINFLKRKAKTGNLRGRLIEFLSLHPQKFGDDAPVGLMLKHMVQRAIIRPDNTLLAGLQEDEDGKLEQLLIALGKSVDFKVAGEAKIGEGSIVGRFGFGDGQEHVGEATKLDLDKVARTTEPFVQKVKGLTKEFKTESGAKLNSLNFKIGQLQSRMSPEFVGANQPAIKIAYKARPLNGIWATAPYLHNGSIPNLDELLKPAASRSQQIFKVGSREFDLVNVGFKTDVGVDFDPKLPGNSNSGHDFGHKDGRPFSDDERKQLIEYLKSL